MRCLYRQTRQRGKQRFSYSFKCQPQLCDRRVALRSWDPASVSPRKTPASSGSWLCGACLERTLSQTLTATTPSSQTRRWTTVSPPTGSKTPKFSSAPPGASWGSASLGSGRRGWRLQLSLKWEWPPPSGTTPFYSSRIPGMSGCGLLKGQHVTKNLADILYLEKSI